MANKKVKGARANKPNDSFGTINNNDLYKNSQYSKDLDKDDDEAEQPEEKGADPVEPTATQQKESSDSFATKKEEVDCKKHRDGSVSKYIEDPSGNKIELIKNYRTGSGNKYKEYIYVWKK